jgi:hypothetical protein
MAFLIAALMRRFMKPLDLLPLPDEEPAGG